MTSESKSIYKDAAFVAGFGRSGVGKTVDCVASFPNAMVCAGTREFKSSMSVLGHTPPMVSECATLFDVEDRVNAFLKARLEKHKLALQIDAVIVDDFTVLAGQTERALNEGSINKKRLADDRASGFAVWNNQRATTLEIAFRCSERLKQVGVHFVCNGHLRVARTDKNGKFIRGGIELPMDLAESFCAGTNMMARILPEPERLFFQTVYSIKNNDNEWATKNQFGLPPIVPSNFRELLNATGYRLTRAAGMEQHEEYVEKIAEVLSTIIGDGAFTRAALQAALIEPTKVLTGIISDPRHVRWILRDASDRAHIRRELRRSILGEILEPQAPPPAPGIPVLVGAR